MRNYILVFEVAPYRRAEDIDEALSKSNIIISWSSPFENCYLLQSQETDAVKVNEFVESILKDHPYYVTAGVGQGAQDITGRLPEAIWMTVNPLWRNPEDSDGAKRADSVLK